MILIICCCLQQFDGLRTTNVSNNTCPHRGFDLLIADLPEGLPVPHISFPPSVVPEWNKHNTTEIEAIFEFAFSFLHDNAFILLFISECKHVRQDVRTYSATYGFTLLKDWWGINGMKLCSDIDASTTVSTIILFNNFNGF